MLILNIYLCLIVIYPLCYIGKNNRRCLFMELRVLQYFLAVAREESISGAAEYLHLSQPTLSRQLKDLEDEP